MRHWFGGNFAAVIEVDGVGGEDDIAQLAGGLAVTFWNAQTGGTQYTDLLDLNGDAATQTTTSDGADGWSLGVVLPVQLDDGIGEAYASVDGGPRFVVTATDTGGLLESLSAQYAAHIAALNPHGTSLGDLADTAVGTVGSRTDGHVLQWDSGTSSFVLAAPDAVAGAVMLDGGTSGNTVVPNSTGESAWITSTNAYSADDSNPDFLVLNTKNATNNDVKVFWFNGNMEPRAAPSLANRVALRVFEGAEATTGASTQTFFQCSTNPTNSANREALLGVYGSSHSTQPGWTVSTRIMAALLGVRPGGSYNSLTAFTFRGQKTGTGAPSTGSWLVGDVVMDSAGALHLCTVAGSPGTWSSPIPSANSSFVAVTPGTNMSAGSVAAATRLENGGTVARLRGFLVAGAAISSNAVLGTVTAAHRPLHTVNTNARTTAGGNRFRVNTDGTIQYSTTMSTSDEIWLDNITWDLVA